jgi:hypothetical protein
MNQIKIMSKKLFAAGILLLGILSAGCGQQPKSNISAVPKTMHLVTPVKKKNKKNMTDSTLIGQQPNHQLSIGEGHFFSYALPPGWRVGEDGQFALSLVAADNKAFTVMVGNAGLMPDYPANQFVYTKMMALQPANLQLSQPSQGQAVIGFQYAYTYGVSYQVNGVMYKGVATCHIAPYYGGCTMAITAAISESSQWPSYASWLPKVSQQIAATNGAAFGMRGVMQQNLRNSVAYAEAAKEYRNWSQQKWQEVTDYRNAVQDKQQEQFRENLGAVNTYTNPYGNTPPVELSSQYKHYWMNQQGQILGTDNPGDNPNVGSTEEWRQMNTKQR